MEVVVAKASVSWGWSAAALLVLERRWVGTRSTDVAPREERRRPRRDAGARLAIWRGF